MPGSAAKRFKSRLGSSELEVTCLDDVLEGFCDASVLIVLLGFVAAFIELTSVYGMDRTNLLLASALRDQASVYESLV